MNAGKIIAGRAAGDKGKTIPLESVIEWES